MAPRAALGADAIRGGAAPVVIASGGAVHSHVHTNLRNSARWLDAMGARAGYLLTGDGIQAEYFQDRLHVVAREFGR